ncbi:anti-phage dCTP deaminase [Bradyrhizobium sp. vgs-9]|uniref:anti-phage dCTP deaminase n=1 Tax=Bradyrhizobium sp. vgs-9 TaxID=208389 RepID=UPI0035D52905
MTASPLGDLLSGPKTKSLASSLEERHSQELIFALVGPIGSGVSTAAAFLKDLLASEFGYAAADPIRPSDIIRAEAHRVGMGKVPEKPFNAYVHHMQSAGNELRAKFGANYLAEKTVERIVKFRRERGGYADDGVSMPGRRAYIIDSIKNLDELNLLRQIYRETLCVVGVFAPDDIRTSRLIDGGVDKAEVQKMIDRDQGEAGTFGQMTRKVFSQSDLFLCNDQKKDELHRRLRRYLEIIFDTSIHTPTRAESAMYEASAAGAGSACMSRQVGASIVSASGELLAVGWNDVPRFGGGLYTEDDQSVWDNDKKSIQDRDNRCFKWGGCICHNETRRIGIVDGIANRFVGSDLLRKGKKKSDVLKLLEGTDVDSLTEYSRSIHAEMEAILSIAREGKGSLVGSTLYTTTYPCHNCARHIVAAGIASVVYIHPYKKSLAIALHNDAISEDPEDKTRVVFRQYDGVAPHHYLRLFSPIKDRKVGGRFLNKSSTTATPVFRVPLDAPTDWESKVIADLINKEHTEEDAH